MGKRAPYVGRAVLGNIPGGVAGPLPSTQAGDLFQGYFQDDVWKPPGVW